MMMVGVGVDPNPTHRRNLCLQSPGPVRTSQDHNDSIWLDSMIEVLSSDTGRLDYEYKDLAPKEKPCFLLP